MIVNWIRYFFSRFIKQEDTTDLDFCKLGFILYEDYGHKVIYKKVYEDNESIHYIEIRLNVVNQIHITSYDQNYMAYRMSLDEINAAMVKAKDLIKEER